MSKVGDLPLGGVHPVGVLKGSGVLAVESLNQWLSLRRLLNRSVSRCIPSLSVYFGVGQKVSPLLSSVSSSSESL